MSADVSTSAGASPPRPADLGADLNARVNEVYGWARKLRDDAGAEALRSYAAGRPRDATTTVVVVGEAKQGKSSLVNSLCGVPGLSPVDIDIATAAWIRFTHGPPAARVVPDDGGPPVAIEIDELSQWALLPPPGDDAALARCRSVGHLEVTVPALLLDGLAIIDTPGVGGLRTGHVELTLAALREATALLFLTDASAPLSAPELTFLERAAENVASVVVVSTKIDDRPSWERIRDENRANLVARSSRFATAPMVGVSSVLADQARQAATEGDGVLAAELRQISGMATLERLLVTRIGPSGRALVAANHLQLARSVAGRLERRLIDSVVATAGDPASSEALDAEQRRLAELQRTRAEWGARLDRLLNVEARADVRALVREGTQALRDSWEQRCLDAGRLDRERLVVDLDADLDALWVRATGAARARVVAALEQLAEGILAADELTGLVSLDGTARVRLGEFRTAQTGSVDALTTIGGSMGGYLLATKGVELAVAAGVLGTTLLPVLLPIAGAVTFAGVSRRVRTGHTSRMELRSWGTREIDRTGGDLHADIERFLGRARVEITETVRDRLSAREAEVAAARAEARAAASRSAQERNASRTTAQANLDQVRKLLDAIDALELRILETTQLTAQDGAGGP